MSELVDQLCEPEWVLVLEVFLAGILLGMVAVYYLFVRQKMGGGDK